MKSAALFVALALVHSAIAMPSTDPNQPGALAAPAPADVSALRWTEGGPCKKDDENCFCTESVRLANVIRAKNGKAPLGVGTMGMLKNAVTWSKKMETGAEPFHHQSLRTTVIAPGDTCETTLSGENIAQNFVSGSEASDPAAVCMKAWENSPGHFANIISDSHENTAIGITVEASGKIWCTQTFSRKPAEPTGSEMCKPVGNAPGTSPPPPSPLPTTSARPSMAPSPLPSRAPAPSMAPSPVPTPTQEVIPMPSMGPEPSDGPMMVEPIPVDGVAKTLMHDWLMVRKTDGKKSVYVRVCGATECAYCRDEDRTSCYGAAESVHFDTVLTAYSL